MSFEPADFASVADALVAAAVAKSCPADAAKRAAIGRYYYAALLAARDFIARSEPMPPDSSETTHRWVINKLRESSDGESQKLSMTLTNLRVARNHADYGDEIGDLDGEVKRAADASRKARKLVQTLAKRYAR